jgi:hypothetical protein
MSVLKRIKDFLCGRPETDEEIALRRKAKMYMLGGGCRPCVNPDGKIIVETKDADTEIRNVPRPDGQCSH